MNLDNEIEDADRLLFLIKRRGPRRAAALAEALGVTHEAVRQRLVRLEEEGLVEAETEPGGRGRPARLWRLTGKAQARFPDTHADLTVALIRSVGEVFGEAGLDRLIQARDERLRADYGRALDGADGLGERVRRLVRLRSAEGYMAECRAEAEGLLFVENHCPICAAASACQGFCRAELDLFREVLDAKVERVEHIVAGARRCAYRIMPKEGDDGLVGVADAG